MWTYEWMVDGWRVHGDWISVSWSCMSMTRVHAEQSLASVLLPTSPPCDSPEVCLPLVSRSTDYGVTFQNESGKWPSDAKANWYYISQGDDDNVSCIGVSCLVHGAVWTINTVVVWEYLC